MVTRVSNIISLTDDSGIYISAALKLGSMKIEDVYADYEAAKENHVNLCNENENLTYGNQSLMYQNQELIDKMQYNRRIFENQSSLGHNALVVGNEPVITVDFTGLKELLKTS